MKLNLLTPLVASAALVSAVPIRVVVVTSSSSTSVASHAGHAGGEDTSAVNVAQLVKPNQEAVEADKNDWVSIPAHPDAAHHHKHHKGAHPCPMKNGHKNGGNAFHGKWIKMSNAFRGAFGMPLIEMMGGSEDHHATMVGGPGKMIHGGLIHVTAVNGGPGPMLTVMHPRPHHHHHQKGGMMSHHRGSTFLQRIHVALMSLGTWEGRAVAFVLGCGLGVLLRMLFVLAVVTVRAIKGGRQQQEEGEEVEYAHVIYEIHDSDAEELAVPPPNYSYPVDEKK